MYLRSISIDNFRALSHIDMSLDEDITVLVGENGCGKSSVLNALEACLGKATPKRGFSIRENDFHREVFDGPQESVIRVSMGFGERQGDHRHQVPLLREAGFCDRQGLLNFSLHVIATRGDGVVTTEFHFHDYAQRLLEKVDPYECLAELRRVCPFLRIRSAALKPPTHITNEEAASKSVARAQVEAVVMQAYSELVEDADCVAEQFIGKNREVLDEVLERIDERVVPGIEDLDDRLLAPLSTSGSWERFAGLLRSSGARSLAMLSFAGSFLTAQGNLVFDDDCVPILAIEDPEAYLHPLMTTSVWNLIERLPTQRVITTNCSDLLSAIPLDSMRRMVRNARGEAYVFGVLPGSISRSDLRRIAYHLRIRRGTALFMRFWLLVEGETEYWLLPEVARAMGYDLWQEGVEFVEFAQCGLAPLASLANVLGISWHLMADGDKAGKTYAKRAQPLAEAYGLGKVTLLPELDVEHCFWENGYEDVFREHANVTVSSGGRKDRSSDIIHKAIKRATKPGLALALGQAIMQEGSAGVPGVLEAIIHDAVRCARHSRRPFNTLPNCCTEQVQDYQEPDLPRQA